MIIALLGLFSIIPGYVHAILLLIFFASAGYFFWSTFSKVRGPGWVDGARRVERDSDLPNRPITEGTDKVAAGKGDPFAEKLWRAHIIRLLASAQRLTLKLPRPNMASRDPRGLRFAVLIGVVQQDFVIDLVDDQVVALERFHGSLRFTGNLYAYSMGKSLRANNCKTAPVLHRCALNR